MHHNQSLQERFTVIHLNTLGNRLRNIWMSKCFRWSMVLLHAMNRALLTRPWVNEDLKGHSSDLVLRFHEVGGLEIDSLKKNSHNWSSRGWDILIYSLYYRSSSKNITGSYTPHNALWWHLSLDLSCLVNTSFFIVLAPKPFCCIKFWVQVW